MRLDDDLAEPAATPKERRWKRYSSSSILSSSVNRFVNRAFPSSGPIVSYSPVLGVSHGRYFAEALHDGVVMHHDGRFVDRRFWEWRQGEFLRQVETLVFKAAG